MGRASLKHEAQQGAPLENGQISRPYGPGLIEALVFPSFLVATTLISRPYGPGLIEAPESRIFEDSSASISRPYGPGLIEASFKLRGTIVGTEISRPYGPGLIEAGRSGDRFKNQGGDFPALWAGPH